MSQLKFVAASNDKLLGSIQWFPVHPTSMNNTNNLVSSDNVGYASILLEEHINNGTLPGKVRNNIDFRVGCILIFIYFLKYVI